MFRVNNEDDPFAALSTANFAVQKGNRAFASFGGDIFNESPDYVICDLIEQCNRIRFDAEGDLINALPDHIIVSILSLLDLKEAARTSILSHRWRNLWKFTSRLVFDDSSLVSAMRDQEVMKLLEAERSRFINWVNNTLKFHQSTTIDEFRVCFDVDEESCKPDIDGWITFAFEKRVQCLHLDFFSSQGYIPWGSYTLTTQFLSNYIIDSLKILRLISVEVTGEVLEYILSTCPSLEVLSVENSKSLVRLEVCGPSRKLKSLEIVCCSLEYIEISASNLMSLAYCGREVIALVNDAPRLIEASFAGLNVPYFFTNICHFSGLLSQLEILALDLKIKGFRRFPKFPKMKNLRHLKLFLDGSHPFSFTCYPNKLLKVYCAKLLKMSPMLNRFTLKVVGLNWFQIYSKVKMPEPKRPHRCLKLIEFIGFVGCQTDIELLLYLIGRAVSLKKLMIDPCSVLHSGRQVKDHELQARRSCAKQLETILPPSAELVIL